MPAESEKQRRFMMAELGRKRAGKKTKTGMTEGQLKDYSKVKTSKRPHGSGPFSDAEIKQGYKKGKAIDPTEHDAWQPSADEYGAVTQDEKNRNVGTDYE